MRLLILSALLSEKGSQSTCAAPPAFNGSMTTLTCIFPENLAESKVNVYVNHYITDILFNEIVLVCKSSNGTFSCSGIPDYQFVKYEKDSETGKCKLIAQISEVNHRHAGKYCCDVSWYGDARESQCEECTLKVMVFSKNLSNAENYTLKEITEKDTSSLLFTLTVVLGNISLVIIVIIIIIVILKCVLLKNRERKAMNTDKSNSEQDGHLLDKQNEKNQTFDAEAQKGLI